MSGKQKLHPGRIFSLASGYWQPCALHAAVKLGIFTCLGDTLLTVHEAAEKTGASEHGLAALLNALTAMEFLEKEGGAFRNTPLAKRYLNRTSTVW